MNLGGLARAQKAFAINKKSGHSRFALYSV